MRRPFLLHRTSVLDLIAFIMVLATGVTLVALGLSPESLAAVTVALASLHSAWRTGRPAGADARQERPRLADRDAAEKVQRLEGAAPEKADAR